MERFRRLPKWKTKIKSLRFVNDTAERAMKLIEEFNEKFMKNEEKKRFLLQVLLIFFLYKIHEKQ